MEIDGAQGEGGGQIIRSSLTLSIITGRAIRLTRIRAGRSKPGLLRQHLTCVQAAQAICHAEVVGAQLGAQELTFTPGAVVPGHYEFQVGTAGSTSLVLQTLVPALMLAADESVVTLRGGTHNPWAPPFEFLVDAYGAQLKKIGPRLSGHLVHHGFYPAGGGEVEYRVLPSQQLRALDLLDRQGSMQTRVTAIASALPRKVAERECDTIRRKANWRADCFQVCEVADPRGPGNVVMIELAYDNVTEIFTGFGKPGVKAEHVARGVLREARAYLASHVPVGPHLADQLLLPLGLAAKQGQVSRFRTGPLTMHSKTHIEILRRFLEIQVHVDEQADGQTLVSLAPAGC